ncbi:putative zinc-binding protein (Yippee) [Trypanosoma grayi]|uniref:putative zinc-binding protein (Yippee) n=1 Tax=Trypanosoma grayi TaxID=71804 RepID=UPI0004F47390|nr:putative zinc-binding protein (Yippee) [Trypanosoma grayi]KEG15481.1 putative zinc-binding protein (Yippee) [Trypanosoma grayi]
MGRAQRTLTDREAGDEGCECAVPGRVGRKRRRSPATHCSSPLAETTTVTTTATAEAKSSNEARGLLGLRVMDDKGDTPAVLCRSVLSGAAVEDTYGCHYHVYPSESPRDAHGTALCWSLRRSSLNVHALMCLGRVANSCRKSMVLFDEKGGISLSYTTTL